MSDCSEAGVYLLQHVQEIREWGGEFLVPAEGLFSRKRTHTRGRRSGNKGRRRGVLSSRSMGGGVKCAFLWKSKEKKRPMYFSENDPIRRKGVAGIFAEGGGQRLKGGEVSG